MRSLLAPLLRIEAVADADLGAPPWAAMLMTSANGARALAEHPRRGELMALPVLAVGRSSAEAARGSGLHRCDLGRRRCRRSGAARGRAFRRRAVAAALSRGRGSLRRIWRCRASTVRTVVAYRAAKAEQFPADAREALEQGGIDGVLHFSRRSVESYLDCGRDIVGRRSGPCIIACRRGPPSRSRPPAPAAFTWPRSRTRRACSLWSRQSPDRIV